MKTSVTLIEPLTKIRQLAEDVLWEMSNALLNHQYKGTSYRTWFGGVICPADAVLHGASNYAILPFAYQCAAGRGEAFRTAMLNNLRFIRGNQHKPGFWNNDNTTLWKGTSVFVLMGLCRAYLLVDELDVLTGETRDQWLDSIERAANWLADDPGLASWNTNYILSSGAALAMANAALKTDLYGSTASKYIKKGLARLNSDGYLTGEVVESDDTFEHAIDPGYTLEMSLPSLVLYAKLANDADIMQAAMRILDTHLPMMMSDGALDVGWGSRGYKWTYLGSLTAHGILMGLLPLADVKPELLDFTMAHLKLMRSFMKDGILGAGAHFWHQDNFLPCMIGTLAKSSGLALGLSYMPEKQSIHLSIDSQPAAVQRVHVIDIPKVVLVRTKGLEASISAVDYRSGRKIMRATIPTGGAICRLSHSQAGRIQLGSHGQYDRVETVNMQEIPHAGVSTPRVEWKDKGLIYSNIFDHEAEIKLVSAPENLPAVVDITGKMNDRSGQRGEMAYKISYEIMPDRLSKRYEITGLAEAGTVSIIEPILTEPGDIIKTEVEKIVILRGKCKIILDCSGQGIGMPVIKRKSWIPIPGIWVTPIEFSLSGVETTQSVFVDIRVIKTETFTAEKAPLRKTENVEFNTI